MWVRFDDHADAPDGTRIYENQTVLVLRTRWGKVVEQHDFYADTAAILTLENALAGAGRPRRHPLSGFGARSSERSRNVPRGARPPVRVLPLPGPDRDGRRLRRGRIFVGGNQLGPSAGDPPQTVKAAFIAEADAVCSDYQAKRQPIKDEIEAIEGRRIRKARRTSSGSASS